MAINIDIASADDLAIVSELAHRIWPPTFGTILPDGQVNYMLELMYSPSSLDRQMRVLNHRFIIAKKDGQPVGFASYELNYKEGKACKLHKIYLLPEVQGTGSGRLLLDYIKKVATENKQACITLNVNRGNKAKEFYTHYGFKVALTEDIDIGQGFFMNDYVMELSLNA